MKLNARAITDLVREVLLLDGHLSPLAPVPAVVSIANAASVPGASVSQPSRRIRVGLDVRPTSLTDRQSVLDSLKRRLGGGQLYELTTDDLPTRVLRVTVETDAVELYGGAYGILPVYVELSLIAADAARVDVEPLVYGLSATPVSCPVGTATTAPVIWLYGGSVTDPVVILRDMTGAEVGRLTCSGTLATDDALVIDCAAHTVDRYVAGVLQTGTAAGLGFVASGVFPVLSPEDASPDGTVWPTLELSAASGTPTGLVAYYRRW